jgi:hypothetical protein
MVINGEVLAKQHLVIEYKSLRSRHLHLVINKAHLNRAVTHSK